MIRGEAKNSHNAFEPDEFRAFEVCGHLREQRVQAASLHILFAAQTSGSQHLPSVAWRASNAPVQLLTERQRRRTASKLGPPCLNAACLQRRDPPTT